MGKFTNIGWCHYTYNFVIGCVKKSICCAKCYADKMDERRFSMTLPGCSKSAPVRHWGANAPRYRKTPDKWKELLRWNAYAESHPWTCDQCSAEKGEIFGYTADDALATDYVCPKCQGSLDATPRRVFVGSLFDWAEEIHTTEERDEWFDIMDECTNLRFMLLTKRGTVMREYLSYRYEGGPVPEHFWVGWSWQPDFPQEVDDLLAVKAKVRFVSAEPLLGPLGRPMGRALLALNGEEEINQAHMKWLKKLLQVELLILGGESDDQDARECRVEWLLGGVYAAQTAGVKVFVKQLGSNPTIANDTDGDYWPGSTVPIAGDYYPTHQGEVAPLRLKHPKGEDPAEWPEPLRVQEMPA